MSAKNIAKGIARGVYKAKTFPLQVADAVGKVVAPDSKVSKTLDSVANPKILKNKGGRVGLKHGGQPSYKHGECPKAKAN